MNLATGFTKCSKCRKGRPARGSYTCETCGKNKKVTKANPGPICAKCNYKDQPCETPGCEERNYAGDGMCRKCYRKKRRYGTVHAIIKQPCEFEDCTRTTRNDPIDGYVLCHRHKQHYQRSGRLRLLTEEEKKEVLSANGGAKPGAGRPPGSKNRKRRRKQLIEKQEDGCWLWKGDTPYEARVDGSSYRNPIDPVAFSLIEEGYGVATIARTKVERECGNPECVRPDHLVVVEELDELALGSFCEEGHFMTEANLKTWETGKGRAYCRDCKDLAQAKQAAVKVLRRRERKNAQRENAEH